MKIDNPKCLERSQSRQEGIAPGQGGAHTITCNNQKLVIVGKFVHNNVGIGRHYLLLWRKLGALFELEVPNGTRQSEIAVDSTKVDETASSCDSGLFTCGEEMTHVSILSPMMQET